MSKPVLDIAITTLDGRSRKIPAVLDTGSFYSLIRQDLLPSGTDLLRYPSRRIFRTAARGGKLGTIGATELIITICGKKILANVLVSSNLAREMIIGAGTMQMWDISIKNRNGKTRVIVGRDMRDPEITEVD